MIKNIYPVIITEQLDKVKNFYKDIFNFEVIYESDWYIQIQSMNNQLAFMLPGLENQPKELRNKNSGEGMIITLEVEDVKSLYEKINTKVTLILELKTEEWGQTHFITSDPSGMIIDIVEYTSPEDYK